MQHHFTFCEIYHHPCYFTNPITFAVKIIGFMVKGTEQKCHPSLHSGGDQRAHVSTILLGIHKHFTCIVYVLEMNANILQIMASYRQMPWHISVIVTITVNILLCYGWRLCLVVNCFVKCYTRTTTCCHWFQTWNLKCKFQVIATSELLAVVLEDKEIANCGQQQESQVRQPDGATALARFRVVAEPAACRAGLTLVGLFECCWQVVLRVLHIWQSETTTIMIFM